MDGTNPTRASSRGFTLVELMIVVAIIGVLAALAVYGIRRYLSISKSAEAKQAVGQISRNATAAFERERVPAETVPEGEESAKVMHELCDSAEPVPDTVPAGTKYQSSSAPGDDFNAGDAYEGWPCLRFRIDQPFYFQFHYTKDSSTAAPDNPAGCDSDCYEAGAIGDVDGDGIVSRFARTGTINAETGTLRASTQVYAESEGE